MCIENTCMMYPPESTQGLFKSFQVLEDGFEDPFVLLPQKTSFVSKFPLLSLELPPANLEWPASLVSSCPLHWELVSDDTRKAPRGL